MHENNRKNRRPSVRPLSIDQQWLRDQLEIVIEWGLDIATTLALRDTCDVASIERVRDFLRSYVAGRRAEVPVRDVLTTVAILVSGIHIEDERTALSVLAPLATMMQMPPELPAVLRIREVAPTELAADDDSEPTSQAPARRKAGR
jgi:hypothetical protein